MLVNINGEDKEIKENSTVAELLMELAITDKVMGVAINTHIIKKDVWTNHVIEKDDKLELLSFVGGG